MIECRVCGAKTDAFMCWADWNRLEDAFVELPGLVNDLADKVRQATRTHRTWRAATVDEELAELEEEYDWRRAAVPSRLRTRDARVTLPQTDEVVDLAASQLMDEARTTLTFWARHLAESRGTSLVLPRHQYEGPVCAAHVHDFTPKSCAHWINEAGEYTCRRLHCAHASCGRIRNGELAGTAAALVRWFLLHRESIRYDEMAAEISADIVRLRDRVAAAVDSAPSPTYMGPCRADHGDQCCARDLYRWHGSDEIECNGYRSDGVGCGAKHDGLEREHWLEDELEDALVPMETLRSFATSVLELRWPPAATIRSWRFRGQLDDRGPDRFGVELFRGGDVLDLVREWADKQATRGAGARSLRAG